MCVCAHACAHMCAYFFFNGKLDLKFVWECLEPIKIVQLILLR